MMSIRVQDLQNDNHPRNGMVLGDPAEVTELLKSLRASQPPTICELIGDNGYTLTVGVGPDFGCVQHAASDGLPPYLMAVSSAADDRPMEFVLGGTATPIDGKYRLPFETVANVVAEFVRSGQRSQRVEWVEFAPS